MGREGQRWRRDGYNSSDVAVADATGPAAAAAAAGAGSTSEISQTKPCADSRKDRLECPLMGPAEVAAITVPTTEVEARLRQVLDRYGAAIVTDVLSPQERERFEALFAADLSDLLDLEAAKAADEDGLKVATHAVANLREWPLASAELLGQLERCQLRGLPHGRFAWAGRLHPRVRRAYEVIHGTNELVSSCDNSFFAPAAHPEQTTNKNWPHVDHNKHDFSTCDDEGVPLSDWEVFQGVLYVWGSDNSHASTTVLWCGSHADVYDEIMADRQMSKRGSRGDHFSRIIENMDSQDHSERLCHRWRQAARRVPVPAGSLLLWSSKTVHQGWSGGPRLAQPVCWEPKGRRSERSYERKLRLAALGLPSTHWASLGIPHTLVNVKPVDPTSYRNTMKGVALPLKSTLRPVALAGGVQVQDMWRHFAKADWEKPLPPDLKELLLKSIEPLYLNAL